MPQQPIDAAFDPRIMLEAIRHAQARFIVDFDPYDSFDDLLEILLSITQSEYGFIGEIFYSPDQQPYLKTHAITNIAWNEETRLFYEKGVAEGLEFHNLKTLFGAVITTGKPVISNDPARDPRAAGLPPGHPPMNSFLGLPFFLKDKIIGMVGVANRPNGYTQELIDWLEPILQTCATLITGYQNLREREKFEEELRESENHLRLSQVGGGIGTWQADLVNNRQVWSESCVNMLGFPALSEPKWEDFLAAVHPEDRQKVVDASNAHIQNGTKYDVEYRAIGTNGDILWLRSAGQVEFDPDGKPVMMRGIAQDITERKLIEIRMHETQVQLQATLAAIPDLLFELDLEGRYHDCHYLSADLLATTPDQFLGRTVEDVLPPEVSEVMMSALHEANQNGRSQGRQYELDVPKGRLWFELSVSRKPTSEADIPRFIVLSRDITARKQAEEEILNLAFYDPLTHLPNRRLLMDRLQHAMDSSARSGREGALLFIDLDNFKTLNDTLGHNIGDQLLMEVAQRLLLSVRVADTVARLGGDEYVVVLEVLSSDSFGAAAQTEVISAKILDLLKQPFMLAGNEYRFTASIGATLFNGEQISKEELIKQADIAMYQAKKAGRNTLRFFSQQMQVSVNRLAALEGELREALDKQQFQLHYQVQVNDSNRPLGAEALIRWIHPELGMVSPLQFIPLAEECGLILPIGAWVLETACAQIKAWQRDSHTSHLVLAVNVSAKQFHQPDFVEQVKTVVKQYAINPNLLKLELTESMLVDSIEDIIETMNALNEIGVKFSLDDFGTGYSSLQYLKRLPLDQLKIDQTFVRDIAFDNSDKAIVRTIIVMAHSLNLNVIAEGVETEEQRRILLDNSCKHQQGYLFSKPLPIEEFEVLLKKNPVQNPQQTLFMEATTCFKALP